MRNSLPSERAAIVGVIDPDANGAAAYSTAWIPMSKFQSILAIILAGDLGSSATVAAKLEQRIGATASAAKDVAGKAMTGYTQTPGNDSNKQSIINCRDDELDVANGYDEVRLTLTVGTATSDSSAIVLGFDPRNGPASDNDLASVDEIVS